MPKDPKGKDDGPSAVELLQSKLMTMDAKVVKLATKGIPDPDWDPKEHPKDSEGKFTEKHQATFVKKGHAKKAKFVTDPLPPGKVQNPADPDVASLMPGEKLLSVTTPNSGATYKVKLHTDGKMTYKGNSMDYWGPVSPDSVIGLEIKAKKFTVLGEGKTPAKPTAHPTIDEHNTFTHPVSGIKWALEPGEKLFQHKTSPNSFLLMDADEQAGSFFNKHGKLIASNPSTKVWTPKNYNLIWPPADASQTTDAAQQKADAKQEAFAKKAAAKEAALKADLQLKAEQAAALKSKAAQTAFAEESAAKYKAMAAKDADVQAILKNLHSPTIEPPLAPWEVELLASTDPKPPPESAGKKTYKAPNGGTVQYGLGDEIWGYKDSTLLITANGKVSWVEHNSTLSQMSDSPADIKASETFQLIQAYDNHSDAPVPVEVYTTDKGVAVNLEEGESLYKYVSGNFWALVKADGKAYSSSDEAKKLDWTPTSTGWWASQQKNYEQNWVPVAGKDAAALPTLEVLHGEDDGPWGSVQNPQGGKIKLLPGDTVYHYPLKNMVVVGRFHDKAPVSGLVYNSKGQTLHLENEAVYKKGSWKHITTVPIEEPNLKKGKNVASLKTFSDYDTFSAGTHKGFADDLGAKFAWGQWSFTKSESFVVKFAKPGVAQRAANAIATLEQEKFPDTYKTLNPTIQGFRQFQEIGELAQLLLDPKSDPNEVENRWAHISGAMQQSNIAAGLPFHHSVYTDFNTQLAQWRFEQGVQSVHGKPLADFTHEDLTAYMTSKGFTAAGGLSLEDAKQWVAADFGSPLITNPAHAKKALEKVAEYKVLSAQAEMSLKKALAPAPAPVSTATTKAVEAQTKALFSQYKKMSGSYKNASTGQTIYHQGKDSWSLYSDSAYDQEMTTKQVLTLISTSPAKWAPSGEFTIAGDNYFSDVLGVWEEEHGSLETADKTVLNKYIKANGGNYVALMKASHKQEWIRLHLAHDEVGKWTLEHKLATATYPIHKWEGSHPGSWGSANGQAARQGIADFLATQPWFDKVAKNDDGTFDLIGLTSGEVSDAVTVLALDVQYGQDLSTPLTRLAALDWWLGSRGKLPEASFKAPEPLQEPAKDQEVPTPPGVTPEAWRMVLAAEQGLPAIKALTVPASVTFSPLAHGLPPASADFLPDDVKHLLLWAGYNSGDTSSETLISVKQQINKAVETRYNQGVWIPPSYVVWTTPKGTKHPLPPGAAVYKANNDSNIHYVLLSEKSGGYSVDQENNLSAFDPASVSIVKQQTKVLQAPQPLTWEQSIKDKLGVSNFTWVAVEQIEAKPVTEVSFPGMTMQNTNAALLTQAIKGGATNSGQYPYLQANAEKLPDGVKLLATYSFVEGNTDTLKTIEYKLKQGHYAQLQAAKVLNPNNSYADLVLKGSTTPDSIYSNWSVGQTNDLAATLGMEAPAWIDQSFANKLSEALVQSLNPTAPVLNKTETIGLPEVLDLTLSSKKLGGMHSKQVWVDQQGNEWMSKGFKNDENPGVRIDAENIANHIGRLIGGRNPETRTMMLAGQYQYVQHLKPAQGDFSGKSPQSMGVETLSQAMEEHVTDWLTSNHDSHPMNILLAPNGIDVIGIDKGQAWRFFGEDKLQVGYLPPSNPEPVWYDQFYKAVQNNSIDKEKLDAVTKRVLIRAHRASTRHDDEVRQLLGEAFDKRTSFNGYASKQALIDGVMARKAALLTDFEAFYKKLYAQGGYTWNIDVEQLLKAKIDDHTHISVTPEFAADVQKSGVHGKALMVNSPDLVDSHILVYTEQEGSKTVLAGEAKVTQAASKKVSKWLKANLAEGETWTTDDPTEDSMDENPVAYGYNSLPANDQWYSILVSAAKTVNHHFADKEYNQGTLNQLEQTRLLMKQRLASLEEWEKQHPEEPFKGEGMVTAEQQTAWKAMLVKYIEDAERIQQAKEEGNKVVPHVSQATYTPSPNLNISGTPKIKETYTNAKGDKLTVWDDNNWVSWSAEDKTKIKIFENTFKSMLELGDWKLQPVETATQTWTYESSSNTHVWVKKPGEAVWTIAGGKSIATDADLENAVAAAPTKWTFDGGQTKTASGGGTWTLTKDNGEKVVWTHLDSGEWKNSVHGTTVTDDVLQSSIESNQAKWTFQAAEGQEQEAKVHVGTKVFKVFKRKAYASKGVFDNNTGELKVSGKHTQGQPGYQYDVEYHDVVVQYRPWNEQGVALSQKGLLRFRVKNWNGSTEQVDDVIDTMKAMGLDVNEASEQSLQLHYWRHLRQELESRSDKFSAKWATVSQHISDNQKAKMSEADELKMLQEAWAKAIGMEKVTAADWMPKFSRFHIVSQAKDKGFTSGKPYWHRPDYDLTDVKKIYGKSVPVSALQGSTQLDSIALSGGMLSTEERIRVLGQYLTGMSSSQDQGNGGANYVYTRQGMSNIGDYQVYYHPRVALRTTSYAYEDDKYGSLSNKSTSAHFDHQKQLGHSDGGNELMIKNGLSFLDDIAVIKFSYGQQEIRSNVIARFKKLGITEIHGLPLEEYFAPNNANIQETLAKVWERALKEAKK